MFDWVGLNLPTGLATAAIFLIVKEFASLTIEGLYNFAVAKVKEVLDVGGVKDNQDVYEMAQRQISSKDDTIERLRQEKEEYELLASAMRKRNIPKDKLIEKYWESIPALIIGFSRQEGPNGETGDEFKFVKQRLKEECDLRKINPFTWMVLPKNLPDELKSPKVTRSDIESWIDSVVYAGEFENYSAEIQFSGVIDLRKAYSRRDYPTKGSFKNNIISDIYSVEEVIDSDDIPTLLAAHNASLSEIVEEGEIAFLASTVATDEDRAVLLEYQEEIESALGSPTLFDIAAMEPDEVAEILDDYMSNPGRVADGIVETANVWENRLYELDSED